MFSVDFTISHEYWKTNPVIVNRNSKFVFTKKSSIISNLYKIENKIQFAKKNSVKMTTIESLNLQGEVICLYNISILVLYFSFIQSIYMFLHVAPHGNKSVSVTYDISGKIHFWRASRVIVDYSGPF